MNVASLNDQIDSTGADRGAALRWGGFVDAVRKDCLDSDNLDAKTSDLLQRLDELAACSGLNEVAEFLDAPRGFSILERNYLMSPLLDQIYACLTVPLRAKVFAAPSPSRAAPVMPFELGIADQAADRIPVRPDRIILAVLVACMKGFAEALDFVLSRERHLVSTMSREARLARLVGASAEDAFSKWTRCATLGILVIQPLAVASYWGHVSCVECLLRHGADVHADQDCALRCAAAEGHDLVVDLLLRAGADIHSKEDAALRVAAQKQRLASVKCLLQAGADVTAVDQFAIRVAAGSANIEVLRCVLDALGDVPLNSGALLDAIRSGLPDALRLVLDRGADPNYDDGRPLHYLVSSEVSPPVLIAMLDMLVNAGADVHVRNHLVLECALSVGTAAAVQRLLHHGVSLLAVQPRAMLDLARRGEVPMIEVLLDAGMPLYDATAVQMLEEAAEHNRIAVIDLFERRGASPASTDGARLVAAAGQGDLQLVQEFLKRELDPIVLHGTALQAAVRFRREPVVAALLKHGQRVGPARAEALRIQQSSLVIAARFDSMHIFRRLLDHVVFDARSLTGVLHELLSAYSVPERAVRLLLDRYAGTLVSVADLQRLLQSLSHEAGFGLLSRYLSLELKCERVDTSVSSVSAERTDRLPS